MDFKERLNSCGRFRTDENFKKIIMKNSCRLRQRSALNQKEICLDTESNKELNNIKVIPKIPYRKTNLITSETKRKENIKEIIFPKDENRKQIKYHRHKSDLMDNNKDNDNKSNNPNILFYYQDIKALKIYKKNVLKQINGVEKKNNNNNNSDENKTEKKKSLKKEIFSNKKSNENNENKQNNEENHIFKSNTIFNNSDRKRLFLMKRMKNDLIKNKINTNDLKRKKILYKKI